MPLDPHHPVAVLGARGAQGAPVVRHAAARGLRVRTVGRTPVPDGAEHAVADLDDRAALTAAFDGVRAVFAHLPIPPNLAAPGRWAANLAAALRDAAVPRLVLTTSGPTDARLAASGLIGANVALAEAMLGLPLDVIVLKPGAYIENLAWPHLGASIRREGVLAYPPLPPTLATAWSSHDDQARVAAAALAGVGPTRGAFDVVLRGTASGTALADLLARRLGRPIRFTPPTPAEFGEGLAAAFGDADVGRALGEMYTVIGREGFAPEPSAVEAAFGERQRTIEEALAEVPLAG